MKAWVLLTAAVALVSASPTELESRKVCPKGQVKKCCLIGEAGPPIVWLCHGKSSNSESDTCACGFAKLIDHTGDKGNPHNCFDDSTPHCCKKGGGPYIGHECHKM
jgi:hypothetical protein